MIGHENLLVTVHFSNGRTYTRNSNMLSMALVRMVIAGCKRDHGWTATHVTVDAL